MRRLAPLALLFVAGFFRLPAAEPIPEELQTPSGPGATAARVTTTATGGRLVLSWIERLGGGTGALYCATLAPDAAGWSPAYAVTAGPDLVINSMDTPQVVFGHERRAAAVWLRRSDQGTQAWTARSLDEGLTWGPPQRLTTETPRQEFVAVGALPDGRFLAVWLDGRPAGATALYGRIIGEDGPDTLIDDRVCDCCAIALTVFPDGSALAVYRDRQDNEVRDLGQARWRADTGWAVETSALPADGWKIAGCPVNGPALSRVGAGLGLVWFTGAEDDPRMMASTSATAGRRWSVGYRLSAPGPVAGHGGAALLRNGTLWTSWQAANGDIALRELRPGGRPSEILPQASATRGVPQFAVARDEPGKPTQLLLVYGVAGEDDSAEASRLVTTRLTLPTAEITLADDCGCDPAVQAERGYAVRGEVTAVDREHERLEISHFAVPGIVPAMTRTVRIDVRLLDVLQRGQPFLGRLEQRDDGDWWLFDVRLLRRP